jgi:uncharacterized membrane protein YdbT with pleckstrin-like domain
MSRYISSNLLDGEAVCYTARLSLWALSGHALLACMLAGCKVGILVDWLFDLQAPLPGMSLGTLTLVALVAAAAYLKYQTTELVVTNRRVIARFGISRRTTVEILLAKVESVQVVQSILARMLNYGSIVVAGGGMHSAPVPNIARPARFRAECTKAQLGRAA